METKIGLIVGELVQPGNGFNIDPATLNAGAVAGYVTLAKVLISTGPGPPLIPLKCLI